MEVFQLKEKFVLAIAFRLKVPEKIERITGVTATRVTLHEKSLNAGLTIPMLPAMADLLLWYNLCPVQLVPNA